MTTSLLRMIGGPLHQYVRIQDLLWYEYLISIVAFTLSRTIITKSSVGDSGISASSDYIIWPPSKTPGLK